MPDIWELYRGLNATSDDSSLDPDGDGISNLVEFYQGTDPMDDDSDQGGESDGSEVSANRDPLWAHDDALSPIAGFAVAPLLQGALVEWTPLPLAHGYHLRYRPLGSSIWTLQAGLPLIHRQLLAGWLAERATL